MKRANFISVLALFASASAMAVEDSWYGRVGFGVTDLDLGGLESDLCSVDLCYDFGTDKGYSLNLGYRLNRYFAMEGGYTDLGEASDTQSVNPSLFDPSLPNGEADVKIATSSSNWSMAALATTDSSRALYAGAKLGFHFWETEVDVSAPGGGSMNALSEDGTDIFYGVFANWRVENWTLGVEHTIFQTEIEGEGMDPSITAVSLSMDF